MLDFSLALPVPFKGWLLTRIEQLIFLKHFSASHKHHLNTRSYLAKWEPIEGLSVRIFIENEMTNDQIPSSKLIFVNNSEADYQELSFSFVAKSGPFIYQHNKQIQIPKQSIAIANLTDIPIESIETNEDGTFTASIRRCYVIIKGIKSADEKLNLDISSEEYRFSHTTLLNGKWKRKWGINWNLDLLESKKRELWALTYNKYITQQRHSISFRYSKDYSSFSMVERVNPIFRITQPFCQLINWEPVLTLRFWALLLLGRIKLDDDSDKSS